MGRLLRHLSGLDSGFQRNAPRESLTVLAVLTPESNGSACVLKNSSEMVSKICICNT